MVHTTPPTGEGRTAGRGSCGQQAGESATAAPCPSAAQAGRVSWLPPCVSLPEGLPVEARCSPALDCLALTPLPPDLLYPRPSRMFSAPRYCVKPWHQPACQKPVSWLLSPSPGRAAGCVMQQHPARSDSALSWPGAPWRTSPSLPTRHTAARCGCTTRSHLVNGSGGVRSRP